MNITQNSLDHLKLMNNCSSPVGEQSQLRTTAYQTPAPNSAFRPSAHHVGQHVSLNNGANVNANVGANVGAMK